MVVLRRRCVQVLHDATLPFCAVVSLSLGKPEALKCVETLLAGILAQEVATIFLYRSNLVK